jgi:hypothetical protein
MFFGLVGACPKRPGQHQVIPRLQPQFQGNFLPSAAFNTV